jgi:catechol 2,3-dioxygenase-like lactoylglutathione lyase family enzyme
MSRSIATVTLLVRDYNEATAWFTGILGFDLVEDSPLGDGKRWVIVAPRHGAGCRLLLARASGPEQMARIGDQTGGRVAFFLTTDNFSRDHALLLSRGVVFLETPRAERYGTVAVFRDIYGNKWDLIEPPEEE